MKYVNANEILPEELISTIQKYYQGGYLYIPKESDCRVKQQTDYKIELEKRNQHIYLKHLEGRPNGQLGNIYHLSESSIRRIILSEKVRYQKMKEIIEQILPLWGIENRQLSQIYPSAREINHSYVIKIYDNKDQLERNIKLSAILSECKIPVAETILTKTGKKYAVYKDSYFLLSKKLRGSNISDIKEDAMAHKMGCAIAQLHRAFLKCEKEMEFWDNSLLQEMNGWVREFLIKNEWQIVSEEEYAKATEALDAVYDYLPKQLIHRDVHFGNFLFFEGDLSGLNGICLKMHTEKTLFSPNGIDKGTLAMISEIEVQAGQKILDLGCGYGVIGIYAAHFSGVENVTMVDINPLAVKVAKENAVRNDLGAINILQSDGFHNMIEQDFDLILSNPPYHANFDVPKNFIEGGFRHLKYGGRMVMVTKRYQWYKNKMESVFGGVKVVEKNGYYIFISEKRAVHKTQKREKQKLSKKLQRKYGRRLSN